MGRIVISTNASLDGVVQDPAGDEGFRLGGWFNRSEPADLKAWAEVSLGEAMATEALLMGRRTDEWFAPRWTTREGEWADRLNGLPKYVVSTSPAPALWANSTVLTGDLAGEVTALKAKVAGDIVVYASYRLGQALLAADLVDEMRLVIFPVVVGGGRRLFGETGEPKPMQLTGRQTVGDNLVLMTYRPVRGG